MKHKPAKGHTHKHSGSGKHGGTGKHHPTHHKRAPHSGTGGGGGGPHGGPPPIVGKHPHHTKARGLALGELYPLCAAEAIAASLTLAGGSVTPCDVLALHRHAGGTENAAVSLPDALGALWDHGLAGVRPDACGPAQNLDTGVIAGIALPAGPHFVTIDGAGGWSWGEWHPWDCFAAEVEEAWFVRWPACL